ncbi:Protein of unknown function (DUF2585) [seawater metagenome]|uniref:DUF2585 family protein n=1 Tax=seawater metagenome TaxID=1561972 RepID=A0A5E8CIG2_9ZZZZ
MKFKCSNHNFLKSLLPINTSPKCYSQHLMDEYSISHILTGLGFYVLFPKSNYFWALATSLFWEIIEQTDLLKNLFNNLGPIVNIKTQYSGDSILNSLGDNLFFILGYYIGKQNPKVANNKKAFSILFLLVNASVVYTTYYIENNIYTK